ncbi:MAG: heme peroxidase family protein [Myxococcales bacterium]|nr:heme peroxidase family protein [Myxococcales bacterium]
MMKFRKQSHIDGPQEHDEILFSTPFDYLFPDLARSPECLLPEGEQTVSALKELGKLMADPGDAGAPNEQLDSSVPAAYTYLGQFIDHDITARTDRNGPVSTIGEAETIEPVDPDVIVRDLRNGRRAVLDLDSVFGDGPGLAGTHLPSTTQSSDLYDEELTLRMFDDGRGRVDLPRHDRKAIIADMRNDENVLVSQLHTAFLKLYNETYARQTGTQRERHIRARQLTRWAYQSVVANDYLTKVCDNGVALDTLANGPRFLGPSTGRTANFMPLEFSVAAFRFGHSMIRPFYELNSKSDKVDLLALLGTSGNAENFDADGQLTKARIVDWRRFVGRGSKVQHARKVDTKIARGLFTLPGDTGGDPVLAHLAQRNLLRGFSLSIPTGQAVADAFGISPLGASELKKGETREIATLLSDSGFDQRTPLWYYVLREAAIQQGGEVLGEVGSRVVCETIVGLLKQDPNSYLANAHDPAINDRGVDVAPGRGGRINDLADLLRFAAIGF